MCSKGNICVNGTMYIYKRNIVFTTFSMAFYRINISVTPLINNVFCKSSVNTFKLHLLKRQLSMKNKIQKRILPETSVDNDHTEMLSAYIKKRKLEAQKSIIVEVGSIRSCRDLISYCRNFGRIVNIYFYSIPKERHYVLLEYENKESANKALNTATYMNKEHIVPTKTNVLWFREGKNRKENLYLTDIPNINDYSNYMSVHENIVRTLLIDAPSISSQMLILYEKYKIEEIEIRLKFQVINNLENYFSGIFPRMIVFPFGSFINGFGWKLSDLDVVVFADDFKKDNSESRLVFHTKTANLDEKQQVNEFMGVLADTMKYLVPGIFNVRKIFNARVPIIKFNNAFTHTECDLSMNNIIAIYMSELLFFYGKLDDRVRPLVFTIRKWAHAQKLTSIHPGTTITNFSLTLLIIFYLQQQNIVPPINFMEGFSENTQCHFSHLYSHIMKYKWQKLENSDNLSDLLLNFFQYYVNFNFKKESICLRTGCKLNKFNNSAMFIHNPFNKELNVSKNVNENEVHRIRSSMKIAIANLENTKPEKSKKWGILSILDFPEPQLHSIRAELILNKKEERAKELKAEEQNNKTIVQDDSEVHPNIGVSKQI